MPDKNKPNPNKDYKTEIEKLTEKSKRDDEPKHKLIDELTAYIKVLTRERANLEGDTNKNQTMINELTRHIGKVTALITQIGNKQLQGVIDKAQANETELTKCICKLREQVPAKVKDPASFNWIKDEFKKKFKIS
jgi:hypothetical protein